MQVMIPCGEDAARRAIELRGNPVAYARKKREFVELALTAVFEKFPALEGHLRLLDAWTPATYKRFTGAQIGSFMSFLFGAGTAPARVDGRVPGVSNLTFCTQWQRAPGGLPNAALCGRDAAKAIAGKYPAAAPEKERSRRRVPARE